MAKALSEERVKRYSKISIALKSCFFRLVYVKQFTIKQSAQLCKLNYSTAKAIIRDLSEKEKAFIEYEVEKANTNEEVATQTHFQRSNYRQTSSGESSGSDEKYSEPTAIMRLSEVPRPLKKVQLSSTVGYDFLYFPSNVKKQEEI